MTKQLLAILLLSSTALAEEIPFDSEDWSIQAEEHRLEEYLGRPALFLHNGSAMLEDADFAEGTIEFDIAFGPERGFSGVKFHSMSPGHFENFYLRPHQSGQPDASQYQPVYNGVTAWQIYYGPQFAAPVEHLYDEWQHVRIDVSGNTASIYVNGEEPDLCVELERAQPGGGLGVSSGFAPAYFSNFRFTENTELSPCEPLPIEELAEATVLHWEVSSQFAEAAVDSITHLDEFPSNDLSWNTLETGPLGFANIGKVIETGAGNTVFARVSLYSREARLLPVEIAYSDRARIFVNGRLVFAGNRNYQLQDHRFLGTVGWYDTIVVELIEGLNVIAIAVSEDFGGWAIGARMPSADDLEMRESK